MCSPAVFHSFLHWLEVQERTLSGWCDALADEALADPTLFDPLERLNVHRVWLCAEIEATRDVVRGLAQRHGAEELDRESP